jgi:choline dehydrogenase-like flavoprotein
MTSSLRAGASPAARSRILGGCSAHNACVILRGAPDDYDEWGDADEADVPILVEGLERLREFGRAQPITRYAARELRPGEDVDAEEHVRATARGFFHPTGTCAIGKVVDEQARVYGYENLLVADASIMPTIPRANTNLTTAATPSGFRSSSRKAAGGRSGAVAGRCVTSDLRVREDRAQVDRRR